MSAQLIKRLTMRSLWPGVDVTFQGKWEEHSWRNVPGPFYGAMTDDCWGWSAARAAPCVVRR
ncbi:hypothetical protein GCM10010169_34070 [Micromonospora fulviviridis]|jgi:hypothetical protein|uniref:hypothetical protein n=1 Tax=Micromonospora fulviviridis TaxID=47860 RepID=UPI00166BD671|nr:hypothetical protein [Micromonospora fulviviridis]GGR87036.1 hypothetical protein GCM10010169_34070 [Micromonospora fulviviridis]